ncbi:Retinol dehydrogenase 8 (Short-chain dehydrogenase) [Pleurostoma richardsiae]|uniref:Retinol dehydrogenase 8 (Short-chain dehydrogenase) n=1 Tax=Pleurostoma richardsiae TaxID=41990 RepID=A0AA38RUI9_9PEZI|nr:Retinol dehydrogenase 8 (Short-chain dehydrogenase) [Pleurostoma richardsiae]
MDVVKRPFKLPADAVWFITGCSSGIGLALATLIATQHPSNRLVATARSPDALKAHLPTGANVLVLPLDVTSAESISAAVAAAISAFGRLDVLVNNAGYGLMGDTEAATDDQARKVVETDFWGTARLTVHAMRVMREENAKGDGPQGGLVMNVTSMGGFVGFPGNAYYHAAKFAVEGFTESVAKEVRPEWNIHFTIIEPGGVQTDFPTRSAVRTAVHPAYELPDSPSRVLDKYVSTPETRQTWALPQKIAEGMYGVASRGESIPLRVPLGPDAWTFMKLELENVDKNLDEVKELSHKVGNTNQVESLEFMRKQD